MASYEQSPQDEGYSEDPLTGSTVSTSVPPWLSQMTIPERTGRLDYVMSIIAQLPTSEVAEIVRRLRPRLYINFFNYLPPEVCLKILGFLDPVSLINTAQASREWMQLALDRRLWEELYILDGFRVIKSEVHSFEESLNADRSRASEGGQNNDEHASKRRATPKRILPSLHGDDDLEMPDADDTKFKQLSIFGPVTGARLTKEPVHDTDMAMFPPKSTSNSQSSKTASRQFRNPEPLHIQPSNRFSAQSTSSGSSALLSKSSMIVLDRSNNKKRLNWQYLYSQRRRLEANWEAEKYINFQLPHPDHPEEAHEECIYTLQYSGKYLVSGSRDKTLRIWHLDTQRLIRPPLRAHTGSVLCLQFDADPEEDLIVSGSSDATVVLWKFSTGQIIQRLRKAHQESVLNVRFDKRVLVTCSKDKTIKIFNRRAMGPGDIGYPHLHSAVAPVPTVLQNYGFHTGPTAGLPIIQPYSMIGCLEGHGAAVNAVQIHGNEIVSASGDRTVKVWNWPDKVCTRSLVGHGKGIACVQYDGRRVVSGSSDNEVKVFDKASGLEVASLRAHTSLVRTVQAGFGDLPYSAEEDRKDAKLIDHEYFNAVDSGIINQTDNLMRGRPRNAGSRKPQDITAYGAQLPPGGGGGRFGRIVSGSYDETIIIWRRDKEGVWRAQHTLRQEEASQVASRLLQQSRGTGAASQSLVSSTSPQLSTLAADGNTTSLPSAARGSGWYSDLVDITLPQGPTALRQILRAHPQLLTRNELMEGVNSLPLAAQQAMQAVIAAALRAQQATLPGPATSVNNAAAVAAAASQPQSDTVTSTTINQAVTLTGTPNPLSTQSNANVNINPIVTATHLPGAHLPNTHPQPQQQPQPNQPGQTQTALHNQLPPNMSRVFKLQFDARRIVCCSQTSVIVGWDFANGDEKLIEASRFFAPIE